MMSSDYDCFFIVLKESPLVAEHSYCLFNWCNFISYVCDNYGNNWPKTDTHRIINSLKYHFHLQPKFFTDTKMIKLTGFCVKSDGKASFVPHVDNQCSIDSSSSQQAAISHTGVRGRSALIGSYLIFNKKPSPLWSPHPLCNWVKIAAPQLCMRLAMLMLQLAR